MMMSYVLIVIVHVSMLGSGNSNAITSINGFSSLKSCEAAAKQIPDSVGVKSIVKTCVEVK